MPLYTVKIQAILDDEVLDHALNAFESYCVEGTFRGEAIPLDESDDL